MCWVLRRLYALSDLPVEIYFKGGTSLSKVFGVIERMSEDIDLVIDRTGLGFAGERDPARSGLSNNARQRLVEEIQASARAYVHRELKNKIRQAFSDALGVEPGSGSWTISLADDDPDDQTILFGYPTVDSASGYLPPSVRLELGARGDPWPSVSGTIRPYAAEEFPDQFRDPDTYIPNVISAERTFWEKATLLHMLHHQPRERHMRRRLARHYYDVFRIARNDLGASAMADTELLRRVVEHKMLLYPRAWAKYELAKPGSLRLVPPEYRLKALRADYNEMAEEMMFGDVPGFDAVIEGLRETEVLVNQSADT